MATGCCFVSAEEANADRIRDVISCVVQCDNLTFSFRQLTNTQTEKKKLPTYNLK